MKLKPNQFRCMVCQEIRIRGVYVRTKDPEYMAVKVCKKDSCKKAAKAGKFLSTECLHCDDQIKKGSSKNKNKDLMAFCRSCLNEFEDAVGS